MKESLHGKKRTTWWTEEMKEAMKESLQSFSDGLRSKESWIG